MRYQALPDDAAASMCEECGALVADVVRHDRWHARQRNTEYVANQARSQARRGPVF